MAWWSRSRNKGVNCSGGSHSRIFECENCGKAPNAYLSCPNLAQKSFWACAVPFFIVGEVQGSKCWHEAWKGTGVALCVRRMCSCHPEGWNVLRQQHSAVFWLFLQQFQKQTLEFLLALFSLGSAYSLKWVSRYESVVCITCGLNYHLA